MNTESLHPCVREVIETEAFFADWIAGRLPKTEAAFARFKDVLAEAFVLIGPDGSEISRAALLDYFFTSHGADPTITRWVDDARVRHETDTFCVVTFVEGQTGARRTATSNISVLFTPDADAPNGVRWLHIHETPMLAAQT